MTVLRGEQALAGAVTGDGAAQKKDARRRPFSQPVNADQLPLPGTRRRLRTASASVSSTFTESSQPMQASVTLWP